MRSQNSLIKSNSTLSSNPQPQKQNLIIPPPPNITHPPTTSLQHTQTHTDTHTDTYTHTHTHTHTQSFLKWLNINEQMELTSSPSRNLWSSVITSFKRFSFFFFPSSCSPDRKTCNIQVGEEDKGHDCSWTPTGIDQGSHWHSLQVPDELELKFTFFRFVLCTELTL